MFVLKIRHNFFVIVLLALFSIEVLSNPIIVKLSTSKYASSFALEFKGDGNTFKFGKFFCDFELVITGGYRSFKKGSFVMGEELSFDDFKEGKTEIIITSYEGVLPATVSYKIERRLNQNIQVIEVKTLISEVIKISKLDSNKNYYTVLSTMENMQFSVDFEEVTASPDGIPYIYEPTYGAVIYHPAKGWKALYNNPDYHRLAEPVTIWEDFSADKNYDNIIKSDKLGEHFDILFGQGLAEYIINRNATQETTDEEVLEYRQIQTLILASIMKYYEADISKLYYKSFLFLPNYSTAVKSINIGRNINLWMVKARKIETRVKDTKLRLRIK